MHIRETEVWIPQLIDTIAAKTPTDTVEEFNFQCINNEVTNANSQLKKCSINPHSNEIQLQG